MSSKKLKATVIIPLHQEEKIASELARRILNFLEFDSNWSFILVCDNCTDRTYDILVRILSQNARCAIVENTLNKGYGNAVNFGCNYALENDFEWALITDSDMSNPLSENQKFFDAISSLVPEDGVVMVKGNRFFKFPPALHAVPFSRMILTCTANLICRILLKSRITKDPTNGFRALNLRFRKNLAITEQGFGSIAQELALIVDSDGKVIDVNTHLRWDESIRNTSQFTFNFETYKTYIYWIMKTRISI
jgi:glycosyltransferase involved in cell wall biosynthesis